MNIKNMFTQAEVTDCGVRLLECVTGTRILPERLPCHFMVNGQLKYGDFTPGDIPRAFYFDQKQGKTYLKKGTLSPDITCLLFGKEWEEEVQLQPNVEYMLQMDEFLYVFRFGQTSWNWADKIDTHKWWLFDFRSDSPGQSYSFEELKHAIISNENLEVNHLGVCADGMEGAFSLKHIMLMPSMRQLVVGISQPTEVASYTPGNASKSKSEPQVRTQGELISPFCWERFDYGDIQHIAMDERLLGDPILGQGEYLRFYATRFNEVGKALDAYDNPCNEIADPYTRLKLPQGYLELPQQIFSLIGAPGSGKSNYLSVLINKLQNSLYQNFNLVVKDADPARNAPLNDMKNCLFGGGSIEQAALLKTQLEGKMYMKVKKDSKILAYPRPFIYTLGKSDSHEGVCNLVFYDNAGEHFEPGIDTSVSPGAQHIAAAAGLLFLVDPTTLPAFRQRLQFHPDPQLKHLGRIDQQDVLLSELEIRIHKAMGLSVNQKVDKPLAVMLGKSDIWMSLVERTRFMNPITPTGFSEQALRNNSEIVRELLLELAPTIVANAESLTDDVMYFPVSAFGHSPTRLPSGSLAPNPVRLKPFLVEMPVIWTLTKKFKHAFTAKPKPPGARLIPG